MKYIISLYNPMTKEHTAVGVLPERRQVQSRITKHSVRRYIESVFGREWYQKNRYLILIITDHERQELYKSVIYTNKLRSNSSGILS